MRSFPRLRRSFPCLSCVTLRSTVQIEQQKLRILRTCHRKIHIITSSFFVTNVVLVVVLYFCSTEFLMIIKRGVEWGGDLQYRVNPNPFLDNWSCFGNMANRL